MKIAVMGYSGAGKSTLARKLGNIYDCPVLHLDRIQFEPGWKLRDREKAQAMVWGFLEENEKQDGSLTEIIPASARIAV